MYHWLYYVSVYPISVNLCVTPHVHASLAGGMLEVAWGTILLLTLVQL